MYPAIITAMLAPENYTKSSKLFRRARKFSLSFSTIFTLRERKFFRRSQFSTSRLSIHNMKFSCTSTTSMGKEALSFRMGAASHCMYVTLITTQRLHVNEGLKRREQCLHTSRESSGGWRGIRDKSQRSHRLGKHKQNSLKGMKRLCEIFKTWLINLKRG